MMGMIEKIEEYFLSQYRQSDYILKAKARVWFYMSAIVFVSTVGVYSVMVIFDLIPMIVWHITLPSLIIIAIYCILLLKKGKFFISTELFFLMLAIVTIIGIYFRYKIDPNEVYATTFYLVPLVIIGVSILCRVIWIYVYTALFFMADLIFFGASLTFRHEQLAKSFTMGFAYSCALLMITFLSLLFIRVITNKALKSVQDELSKNIDLNRDLGSKHDIFLDVAGTLEKHFNDLKRSSSDFQDGSQNTAASLEEVSSAAEEVMSGVEQVFSVISDQYEGLIKLLNKMKELSEITLSISEQIQKVSRSTKEITAAARQGNDVLRQMHSEMSRVSESTRAMENIATMINDIADKINLLSLNASIEAARAGTSGRGFAVVAEEISRLGAMTQSSMGEINRLIQSSSNDVNAGLISVDATVVTITNIIDTINGILVEIKDISNKTETQQEINAAVNTESDALKNKSDQIKDMMSMQQIALDEITKSIVGINDITQSYIEGSRKLHSDAEMVGKLVELLRRDVSIQ